MEHPQNLRGPPLNFSSTGTGRCCIASRAESNLKSITDAMGRVTCFQYTTQGWLSETDFQAGVGCTNTTIHETYTYDALGNLQFKTDRKGQQINYYYDSANQLNFKGWQYANPANNVTYHYDVANRLTSVDDGGYTGAYSFIYDNMDRLSEADVAYSFLSGTYRVNYTYDAASNLKTMQDPQAGQNTYNYDVLNRLYQLISPAGTFGFGYDFDSRRTSLTRPNNITTTYTYDNC